ncbi:VACUOLAR PROTEIN SORTING-ASSOCIATED PROTEIN VPS13 [Salix purpurea]|uniref:VACUOLAR PROTEIN SORTING-ASSOCIATED PROTEIN VPS13 n=1 Tax=Salix purpurea TaxID=77065 RepID=A0A9Q0VTW3_SALPP|nr:VACUOLAR PROTEIN SORTING-ASSOCIATED PROTEIN VPS13 [Salix purpurea]
MRNNAGVLRMIRVEVQNANVSVKDEKIIGSLHGNSGTNLILLSDDDTGFMPYRIDNFSKERLRVYQQKCENFDTVIHPYTSCAYAWDEPCFPHRLTVEVPGERVIGSYALDDLKEYIPVQMKTTAEKPERTLLLSVHAEGAIKVLSIVDSSFHVLKDFKDPSSPWFREKTKHEQKQKDVFYYKEKFSVTIPYIGVCLINSYPQELLFACAKNLSLDLLQSLDQQKISFQISSLQIDNQLQTTPYPVILSFNQEYRGSTVGQRVKDDIAKSKGDRVLQRSCEPILSLAVATWRKKDISLLSFEYISLRVANFRLELDQEVILRLLDFYKAVSSRFQSNVLPFSDHKHPPLLCDADFIHSQSHEYIKTIDSQLLGINLSSLTKSQINSAALPSVVPIGAPWQHISFLDGRQKKIYVELFDLAPVKFTLSFSSAPWMLRNGIFTSGESLIHRGLMALADVEGARIHLNQLRIEHQMASWESMQDILIRHYTRQLLHEMYKVFGSAGVIGNPMGFARSLGLGIRDFLSVPARSFLQSPSGLITGVAQGTTSLVSNTVYALSDAATQFSKAAQKGIVAFTFNDQSVARMEKQQKGAASHSNGVINEVLEGLTGLLQSPIKEAEKHGLPGVLSGIAFGVAGLVARPAASILEVTGKTAQSIRNRSRLYQMGPQCYRVRLPRPLSRELPLRPYSLEEAVGTSVLMEADVCSPGLVDLGKPEFRGVPIDPEWLVESEISLESVIHADAEEEVVHIVGTRSDAELKQNQHQSKKGVLTRTKSWNSPISLPLSLTNLELASMNDAKELLQILLSMIAQGKERRPGSGYVLHRSNIM